MAANKILLVGHCGADAYSLENALHRLFKDVPVQNMNDLEELEENADGALLLVNRVLDGDFETDSGVELIRRLAGEKTPAAMMLVSDFDQAQTDAVAAGAQRGFGKSQLRDSKTVKLLEAAVRG